MKFLIVFFFTFCIISSLFSQTVITGHVKDDKTNESMMGVNISVVGKTVGTVTDWEGNFELKLDQAPPLELRFSMVGFISEVVQVTQANQEINISLQEEQTQLNEVIISASRTPERVMESPVTIERMDTRDIKNTTSATFYDGLVNLKGVDVNTNSFTFKSVNTRGFATFANTRFVQLVDGMDNSSPALNFPIGNMLGMSELDVNTVELLPGASSALYGANAFNGIMFMESKNPFEFQGVSFYGKTGVTVQQAAGTNQFVDAGFRAAHAFSEKFAAKASVSFLNGTEWWATDYNDYNISGADRSNPAYDGLNVYGDEVFTTLNFEEIAKSVGVPDFIAEMMGSQTVSRTGYNEADLIDYSAESLKADVSLNYRPKGDDLEIILNSKFGMGNTIYQGANRYSIQNFYMYQNKLEVRSDNFFVRGYMTGESAGDSYDSRFAAINVNRKWKSDTQWFTEYAGAYIQNFVGTIMGGGTPNPAASHEFARSVAQTGVLVPGTAEFDKAFNEVISNPDIASGGAKFADDTRIYHVDANYNFKNIVEFADIQIGGSWRQYSLNSSGTIFTDYDNPINYNEFGAYAQLQKMFADDRLKFTGSVRLDKAKHFDAHFSPRLSLVYSAGEKKNHNIRVSYQTGFRNPTTQDLYIGLDAGRAILVGSAPDNLDRYTSLPLNVNSPLGQIIVGGPTVQLSGARAYDNAFTLLSMLDFAGAVKEAMEGGLPAEIAAALNAGLLKQSTIDYVKPEKVNAYELGYRGVFKGISIDLSGYYNAYDDFIGNKTVIVPYYGDVSSFDPANVATDQNTQLLLNAIGSEDFKPFQVYTNSTAEISSYGVGIGVATQIFRDYDLSANYVWSRYDFDQSTDPDYMAGFNTPEHVFKASFGSQHVIKNLGFNINFRWYGEYLWESSFIVGTVPSNAVFDAQVNYSIRKWKSLVKIGGANIGGNEYYSAPGTGYIGSQYYASWTVNL